MAVKGVVVDFDFAAMDGAGLLFDVARRLLGDLDRIPLDEVSEARLLVGNDMQQGLSALFRQAKTKKTAAKAAKDLAAAFVAALDQRVPSEMAKQGFRKFVNALADKGVKVVVVTRALSPLVDVAFAGSVGDVASLQRGSSSVYGGVAWDFWRRAAVVAKMATAPVLAVTGSASGVKAALKAGVGSVAVVRPRQAYQDFGGADAVVGDLNAAAAKAVLGVFGVK